MSRTTAWFLSMLGNPALIQQEKASGFRARGFRHMSEDKDNSWGYAELSADEQYQLVLAVRSGEPGAIRRLEELAKPVINKMARFYSRNGYSGEARHNAWVGLLTAVRDYKPEVICPETKMPYRFDWFAWVCMRSNIVKGLVRDSRAKLPSLEDEINSGRKVKTVVLPVPV